MSMSNPSEGNKKKKVRSKRFYNTLIAHPVNKDPIPVVALIGKIQRALLARPFYHQLP